LSVKHSAPSKSSDKHQAKSKESSSSNALLKAIPTVDVSVSLESSDAVPEESSNNITPLKASSAMTSIDARSNVMFSKASSNQPSEPVRFADTTAAPNIALDVNNNMLFNAAPSTDKYSSKPEGSKPSKLSEVVVKLPDKEIVKSSRPDNAMVIAKTFDSLMKHIRSSISSGDIDSAKSFYADALKIYKSMDNAEKSLSYERLNSSFKMIDEAAHKETLNDILDEHLVNALKNSVKQKDAVNMREELSRSNANKKNSEKTKSKRHTAKQENTLLIGESYDENLPVALSNDDESSRIYELIEESYANMSEDDNDAAMLKYFKALELYHQVNVSDKKKLYESLYELFKKLSEVRKN
jgi:hypothetical protein